MQYGVLVLKVNRLCDSFDLRDCLDRFGTNVVGKSRYSQLTPIHLMWWFFNRSFRPSSGLDLLAVRWVSKAQVWQRSGRAGREAPGVCYRLYTENEFDQLAENTTPEILRLFRKCVKPYVSPQMLKNYKNQHNTVKLRYNGLLGTAVKGLLYPKSIMSKLGYRS